MKRQGKNGKVADRPASEKFEKGKEKPKSKITSSLVNNTGLGPGELPDVPSGKEVDAASS